MKGIAALKQKKFGINIMSINRFTTTQFFSANLGYKEKILLLTVKFD